MGAGPATSTGSASGQHLPGLAARACTCQATGAPRASARERGLDAAGAGTSATDPGSSRYCSELVVTRAGTRQGAGAHGGCGGANSLRTGKNLLWYRQACANGQRGWQRPVPRKQQARLATEQAGRIQHAGQQIVHRLEFRVGGRRRNGTGRVGRRRRGRRGRRPRTRVRHGRRRSRRRCRRSMRCRHRRVRASARGGGVEMRRRRSHRRWVGHISAGRRARWRVLRARVGLVRIRARHGLHRHGLVRRRE